MANMPKSSREVRSACYLFSKYLVIEFRRYHITGGLWYF